MHHDVTNDVTLHDRDVTNEVTLQGQGPVLQVQPDMDELDGNMEDNEDVDSAKEELKLGKLQFSLDYDFQKSEVRSFSCKVFHTRQPFSGLR